MIDDLAANVAAYEQTVRSSLALAESFTAADWDRPTECPGWTVKDQYAHLAGVETMLLEGGQPDHTLPEDLPHVRNDFGRIMEVGVDLRRPRSGPEIAAELAAALERRLAALANEDPGRIVRTPDGNMGTYTRFMAFRALDCWAHEQDIRRAVNRPGNLDAPAAYCLWALLGNGLRTVVASRSGALPGQVAAFTIVGPPSFQSTVCVGEDGTSTVSGEVPEHATVRLTMSWETYVRLATGRCSGDEVPVKVEGDQALAERILSRMALTP